MNRHKLSIQVGNLGTKAQVNAWMKEKEIKKIEYDKIRKFKIDTISAFLQENTQKTSKELYKICMEKFQKFECWEFELEVYVLDLITDLKG
jgi:hypothetical protein